MAEWREEQLGGLVSFEYGSALRAESRTGSGFNVYGSNGVVGSHDTALVSGPGIIIGRKGSVGALHWSKDDFWPIDTTYWVKPKEDLDLRWMREALALAGLESLDSSTGVPGLNRYDAYERGVPVPPLEEQQRIAEILDTIDETIQATERVIAKRTKIRAGLAASLLSGKPEGAATDQYQKNEAQPASISASTSRSWDMSESRKYVTLRELADLNPESLGAKTPADHSFKYIDLSSVNWGSIDMTLVRQFRFAEAPSRARRVVRDGDVLFGTVRPQLRPHARVTGEGFVASTGFCVTRPKAGMADGGFLGHYMLSDQASRQAARREVGSNYPAITERDVGSFRLPRISLEEQRRIAEILDTVDESIRANEQQRDKLQRLRSGLAADLLSGHVRTVTA